MQTLECHAPRVLFVNKNEEDTNFLTRDLAMEVVRTDRLEAASEEVGNNRLRGIFIDVASAQPTDIVNLKKSVGKSEVPIFILTDTDELPQAIEYVKLGAQGFLVKGLSHSDSVLKLMQYATSQH